MNKANPHLDDLSQNFKDLKQRIADLEAELATERRKTHAVQEEKRLLVKERDDALLLRGGAVWPAAVDYILRVAPWNAIRIEYDAPRTDVIQVEMRPVKWTFRQGDMGLFVEEHEIAEKHKR